MHLDLAVVQQMSQIPPWKLELLSRRSALARAVEPKLNEVLLDPVHPSGFTPTEKADPKYLTTWKELKDGAGIVSSSLVNNFQRPLSRETRSSHPQVVTCATLFNGDGAFKSSNVEPADSVVEEGGASKLAATKSPGSPSPPRRRPRSTLELLKAPSPLNNVAQVTTCGCVFVVRDSVDRRR